MVEMEKFNTEENLNAYTKILKEKLGNEGVSVNEDTLAKTLVDAQKQMVQDCSGCNGYRPL